MDVDAFVAECGAFLTGGLAAATLTRGRTPRHWEWLNLLAHGTEAQVHELAQGAGQRARTLYEAKWLAALSFLASELLDVAASGAMSLRDLQRTVLVPLELELAADAGNDVPIPAWTVRKVLDRLTSVSQLRQR